jgi:hypothetical protein
MSQITDRDETSEYPAVPAPREGLEALAARYDELAAEAEAEAQRAEAAGRPQRLVTELRLHRDLIRYLANQLRGW